MTTWAIAVDFDHVMLVDWFLAMRQPGIGRLDEADFRELDIALGEIEHLFTVRR